MQYLQHTKTLFVVYLKYKLHLVSFLLLLSPSPNLETLI